MKHIKKVHFYLITILIPLLFFGCHCPLCKKQGAKINLSSEPESLDPAKAHAVQALSVVRALFEGLTRMNAKGECELALAEKVEISEDLKTYTFSLRPSKWTSGDPLTAEHFAYAWKRALDPAFISDQAFQLYPIKNAQAIKKGELPVDALGVTLLDSLTLQVQLEEPTSYFLTLTALPIFFPVPMDIDKANSNWAKEVSSYVSNGPFTLKTWDHHSRLLLEKNSSYWDQKTVELPLIEMLMIDAAGTELQLFEKRELDWAGSPFSVLPLDAVPELKVKKKVYEKPLLGTFFICINTRLKLLASSEIRRALAQALDRKAIIDHVTYGTQLPATQLVPPSLGLRETPPRLHCEGESLQYLLNVEKSLTDVTLLYRAEERSHQIAQAIQNQWFQAFGRQIKLEALESKAFFARLAKRDFQLTLSGFMADFEDPINFLETFKYKRESANRANWQHPDYIALLDKAKKSIDVKQRANFLGQCEEILLSEVPIIPLFHYNALYLKNENLHDVVVSPLGVLDFKWAYFKSEPVVQTSKPCI
jgi:oligopeptide transport system substrate-binding protein